MKYAKDILEQTTKTLGLNIRTKADATKQQTNHAYERFGAAAGVISSIGLYAFLRDNSEILSMTYRSGKLIVANWEAIHFTWDVHQALDCNFIDAAKFIHELHQHWELIDLGHLLDGLDLIDAVETVASLGLGIIVSRGIKYAGDKFINKKKLDQEKQRKEWMASKMNLLNLLGHRFPVHTLSQEFHKLPPTAQRI